MLKLDLDPSLFSDCKILDEFTKSKLFILLCLWVEGIYVF